MDMRVYIRATHVWFPERWEQSSNLKTLEIGLAESSVRRGVCFSIYVAIRERDLRPLVARIFSVVLWGVKVHMPIRRYRDERVRLNSALSKIIHGVPP